MLYVLIVLLLVNFYLIIRNEVMYYQAKRIFQRDSDDWKRLPSVEKITFDPCFWRWDIEHYLKEEQEDEN